MLTSVKQMMEAANAVVPKITPAEAREMIAKGNTLVVMCAMRRSWRRAARLPAPCTTRVGSTRLWSWTTKPAPSQRRLRVQLMDVRFRG
jgi:hypothetical protein